MISRMKLVACILAISGGLMVTTTAARAASDLYAAAKREGQVVWYTTLIVKQAVRPIVAAFEKNTAA